MNLKSIQKFIKDKNKTEITKYKGEYYILHICNNNTPVPLFHDKDILKVKEYLDSIQD